MLRWIGCVVFIVSSISLVVPSAQSDLHAPFDRILDTYVRDGYVYYLALKKERAAIDRYVASLDVPRARVEGWGREEQAAFWINAYNALVLRTVIDAYPIHGRSAEYPASSIRQIPGAFEGRKHRVAGDSLTLDEIEKNHIVPFGDARMLLALGRGAIGSPRLHSEVYRGATLDTQLAAVVKECAERISCATVSVDRGILSVTPILSWREATFAATFGPDGEKMWPNRTPIERAAAAMIYPHLFSSEKEFLAANNFRMEYAAFDWRLNDLTGGVPQ
jgi:hypothetical protein